MKSALTILSLSASLLLLAACAHSPIPQLSVGPNESLTLEQTARWAQIDLANALETELEQVRIVEAREVVWSDGAIGCPRPEGFYTQALVEGYLVVLSHHNEQAYYHSSRGQKPFLCPPKRRVAPVLMEQTIY